MKKLLIALLLFLCVAAYGQEHSTFKIAHIEFSVSGKVSDQTLFTPIKGANVEKVGSDGTLDKTTTDSAGFYSFDSTKVKPNTSYIISANAQEQMYSATNLKTNITTVGLNESKNFTCNFELWKCHLPPPPPRILFAFGSTNYIDDTALTILVKLLVDNSTIVIQFDAHSSPNEGDSTTKNKLSVARSQVCKDYLTSHGIDSDRVKIKGWGDKQTLPGCSADDIAKMKTKEEKDAAYANDRRVTYRVVSFNYKPKQ